MIFLLHIKNQEVASKIKLFANHFLHFSNNLLIVITSQMHIFKGLIACYFIKMK